MEPTRWIWIAIIGSIGAAILADAALGSSEGIIESTQPTLTEDFIRPATVSYIKSGMVHVVGSSVWLTCSESAIETDTRIENRNAASLFGFTIQVVENPDSIWHPLYGDTLRVILDVTSIGDRERLKSAGMSASSEGVMDATFDCILENAGRGVPAAKYLDLRVIGAAVHARRTGVYPVSGMRWRETYD